MDIKYDKKPNLSASPDTYFGLPGNITFAYRNGHLIWSEKGKLFVDGKKIMNLPPSIKSDKIYHRVLMELYGLYTHADEYENAKKDDINKLIRGRTNPERTTFNLWGSIPNNIILKLLKLCLKYNIIKKQPKYIIKTTGRNGTKTYIINNEELNKVAASQISPHQSIRQHIYKTLGLESKKKLFRALLEALRFIK